MKTSKKCLPDWIVKRIEFEQENECVNSAIVGVTALYIVGVVGLFVFKPFGGENLWMESCLAICLLALIIASGFFFVARVTLLQRKRIKASKFYEKAKSEIEQAVSDIEKAATDAERSDAKRRKNEAEQRKAEWREELNALFVKVKEDD